RLPQSPSPGVYFSMSKRPQVILFGRDILLTPGTKMAIGAHFTVVVDEEVNQCVVKRIAADEKVQERKCSNRVDDVLLALADVKAGYPDIVDFLRKAHDSASVNCPIAAWTTPEVSLETLLEVGLNLQPPR